MPKPLRITRRAARELAVAEPPAVAFTPPVRGDSLPVEPGGHGCPRCGVYVISPTVHTDWHRENDENADRWNFIRSLVLRVFQAWGYVTTDENAAANDGNSHV